MDQAAQNKAIIQRFYEEALNRRNIHLIDSFLAPQVSVQSQSNAAQLLNRDGFKNILTVQWRNTPDHQYRIVDMVARGDEVIVRLVATFQHRIPVGNIPPTGRILEAKEICFYQLQRGLIIRVCTLVDEAGIMQQSLPTPGPIARW